MILYKQKKKETFNIFVKNVMPPSWMLFLYYDFYQEGGLYVLYKIVYCPY